MKAHSVLTTTPRDSAGKHFESALRRREFLAGATAAATLAGFSLRASAATPPKKKLPIGLQLYAVREEFARSVPETLKAVARSGYAGVEFWGYGGTPNVFQNYSAQQLRQLLDDNKLQCCGIHLQVKALETAQLERTIENNRILGNRFLVVAAAKKEMSSLDGIKAFAAFLSEAHEKCRPHGMRVGYHAHGFDFDKLEGRFAWDHLFSQTRPEVIMQMDIANCLGGGGDPLAMLEKFPGRALSLHIRETGEKTFASEYYREVFRLAESTAKTEWYVVEQGGPGGRGFAVSEQALQALHRLGK
ncbi:MAG: sugar phosphate isomerase/epimerase [Verrucomicrobia bacterium]|nr:sugar phosphate isomerase/epimerase [Verrucomicrobiota bacterium]